MNWEPAYVRIGDAERERAAADLSEHYAVGRLSHDEHAERLDAVWTARTRADLEPIFEDLPTQRSTGSLAKPARTRSRWHSLPFLPIAAALILLSVLFNEPLWILIFFVGCGLFTRRVRLARDHFARTRPVRHRATA